MSRNSLPASKTQKSALFVTNDTHRNNVKNQDDLLNAIHVYTSKVEQKPTDIEENKLLPKDKVSKAYNTTEPSE